MSNKPPFTSEDLQSYLDKYPYTPQQKSEAVDAFQNRNFNTVAKSRKWPKR